MSAKRASFSLGGAPPSPAELGAPRTATAGPTDSGDPAGRGDVAVPHHQPQRRDNVGVGIGIDIDAECHLNCAGSVARKLVDDRSEFGGLGDQFQVTAPIAVRASMRDQPGQPAWHW